MCAELRHKPAANENQGVTSRDTLCNSLSEDCQKKISVRNGGWINVKSSMNSRSMARSMNSKSMASYDDLQINSLHIIVCHSPFSRQMGSFARGKANSCLSSGRLHARRSLWETFIRPQLEILEKKNIASRRSLPWELQGILRWPIVPWPWMT